MIDIMLAVILFVLATINFGLGFGRLVAQDFFGGCFNLFAGCFALFVGIWIFKKNKKRKNGGGVNEG